MDLKQLHFYLINNCHGSYPFTSCPHQIWKEYWNICEQISVYLCSCSRILSDLIRSYPSAQFTVSCKGVGWRVQGGSWSWLMSPAILQDVTCLTKHRNFYTLPPPLLWLILHCLHPPPCYWLEQQHSGFVVKNTEPRARQAVSLCNAVSSQFQTATVIIFIFCHFVACVFFCQLSWFLFTRRGMTKLP